MCPRPRRRIRGILFSMESLRFHGFLGFWFDVVVCFFFGFDVVVDVGSGSAVFLFFCSVFGLVVCGVCGGGFFFVSSLVVFFVIRCFIDCAFFAGSLRLGLVVVCVFCGWSFFWVLLLVCGFRVVFLCLMLFVSVCCICLWDVWFVVLLSLCLWRFVCGLLSCVWVGSCFLLLWVWFWDCGDWSCASGMFVVFGGWLLFWVFVLWFWFAQLFGL